MTDEIELKNTIITHTRHISCDGGEGIMGHPKVYFEIKSEPNEIYCNYCGKHFVYKEKD